ncbi:hypothetical protein ACVWXO_000297 [Bradyrhizobium sp. LM2.7]
MFERFLAEGRIELDSNIAERAIRPPNNYGEEEPLRGQRRRPINLATIATLLQTAKMNDDDPFACLAVALIPWNHAA